MSLDKTPSTEMGETPVEVAEHVEPVEHVEEPTSKQSPHIETTPVIIGSGHSEPVAQPKGNLVMNLNATVLFSLQHHFQNSLSEKPSLSLSAGGLQKKVAVFFKSHVQKGITRKGLGGKKIGVNTTVEPIAESKPAVETVSLYSFPYLQASKYGTSLVLEKVQKYILLNQQKSDPLKPVVKKEEPAALGSASDRFKGYKGISSDQYFGREQVYSSVYVIGQYNEEEGHEKLKQFAGARSISSAQYYGNNQQQTQQPSFASSLANDAYNLGSSAASKIMSYFGKKQRCLFHILF